MPAPAPAEFVAVFQKDDASPAFLLTFDLDKRQFTVRRVGAEPQAGRSYELWLVSEKFGGQPRSLGVIGAQPYTVREARPEYDPVTVNRATFGISLEPEGGSPTGRADRRCSTTASCCRRRRPNSRRGRLDLALALEGSTRQAEPAPMTSRPK